MGSTVGVVYGGGKRWVLLRGNSGDGMTRGTGCVLLLPDCEYRELSWIYSLVQGANRPTTPCEITQELSGALLRKHVMSHINLIYGNGFFSDFITSIITFVVIRR